jgi:hypothetical protein
MLKSLTIRREGSKVLLLSNGILIAEMPWQAADDLARALRAKARKAEEEEKALQIIADNAILLRAGFPLGLTNRPDLIAETIKEAVTNRDLRRYMPGGVKSEEVFGVPGIIQHPPKEKK